MQEKVTQICSKVLKRITPEHKERAKMKTLAKKLEKNVASASEEFGIKAEVRVEGSVAKDTWISREPDIDVFMRVPTSIPRKSLGDVALKIARRATEGSQHIERFAEHPYLEAIVDDVRVNIVPCYKVEQKEWLSATDRTPFHTDYAKKHLTERMHGEVRLLKKFMKGVDVYGAEIKIGGFSGYLCELLVMHFKSFIDVLNAFAHCKGRVVVDIEGHYKKREDELPLLFPEPLLVIDPVDKGRNVASAVQTQKLYTFIAAARGFLEKPDMDFFYPPETKALTAKKLKQKLEKRGSATVFVTFGKVDTVPDILWGQLYKSQRSLCNLVKQNDFKILRNFAWSDEKTLNMFVFELEQRFVSPVKKHLGPPLKKEPECKRFLRKHLKASHTVSGPYIDGGRWVVERRRNYTDVVALLSERLMNGGRNTGVAEKISHVLRTGFKISVNGEILKVYNENSEFAKVLTEFLSGKPKWLETA